MNIKGKITHVLETVTGTSAKGDWTKQGFVLIETEGDYPKSIAFDAFNKGFNLKVGDLVDVSINIESREYNGKWYTNIGAWKVDILGSEPSAEPEPIPQDELPF